MAKKKSYAVIGLGRYGKAVARELLQNGAEVLAIDIDPEVVNTVAKVIPHCKCADVTNVETIKQLGIADMDAVIIAMASRLEDTVMATMLCKEAGVKTVIAKCSEEIHRKILSRVGADKVVFPESESGHRLAKNLLSSGFVDIIDLTKNISMIELAVRPEWYGKPLLELNLRRKYSINVVAIRRGKEVSIEVDPAKPLEKDMQLIVIADKTMLGKLK